MKNKKLLTLIISVAVVVVFSLITCLVVFLPNKTKADDEVNVNQNATTVAGADYASAEEDTGASTASSKEKGGVVYLGVGATYTMVGGTMKDHKNRYGGAVYVSDGAVFTMTGGLITNCKSEYGGAIYVASGGTCIILGGEIVGNKSESAAIFVEEGGCLEVKNSTIIHDNYYANYSSKINYYVDGVFVASETIDDKLFDVTKAPLSYDDCCGYFLDSNLTEPIEDGESLTVSTKTINVKTSTYNEGAGVREYNVYTKTATTSKLDFTKENAENYSVRAKNNVDNGEIVIPKTYQSVNVTKIEDLAFMQTDVESVVMPTTIKYIGEEAFFDSELLMISIQSNVSYIGDGVFASCDWLARINVSKNNSVYDSRNNSNAIIETGTNKLIAACKKTVIPQSVTIIGSFAYSHFSGVEEVTIPSHVETIQEEAFYCSELEGVTLENGINTIENYAFSNCANLKSLNIPESVTHIGEGIT